MTTRAETYQRRVAQEREALLAKARTDLAREDAEREERLEEERAEERAWTEVRREREARRREAEAHALAQVTAPVTGTSEEDSEMTGFGKSKAAPKPATKRKVTDARPRSAAGRKRALKGAEGVKAAQAHVAEKKAQQARTKAAVKTGTELGAAMASGAVKGWVTESRNGAEHPATDQFAAGKEKGVRVAGASRGGFHVIVVGTLNRALKGVFPEAEQAKGAAEAAGLDVKAMPRK